MSELFAFREEQMHAKANAQRWRACLDFFDERPCKSKLLQISNAVAERADAGQDQLFRLSHIFRIRCDENIVAKPAQRIFQAAKIVQFVINDGDHKTPFVDGISECSIRVAMCSAIAVALKIVSAMWC